MELKSENDDFNFGIMQMIGVVFVVRYNHSIND